MSPWLSVFSLTAQYNTAASLIKRMFGWNERTHFALTGMHKSRLQESRMKGSNGIWELPVTPYGMP